MSVSSTWVLEIAIAEILYEYITKYIKINILLPGSSIWRTHERTDTFEPPRTPLGPSSIPYGITSRGRRCIVGSLEVIEHDALR